MTPTPSEPLAAPARRSRKLRWLLALGAVLGAGGFVVRGRAPAAAAMKPEPRAFTAAAPEVQEAVRAEALDPLAGQRTPGPVQRVGRLRLRAGQTAAAALAAAGVAADEANGAIASLSPHIDFRRMRPGDTLTARLDAAGHLLEVGAERGILEQAHAGVGPAGWRGERVAVAIDTVVAEVSGQVRTSLWDALVGNGEDGRLVALLVDIFAYDIDFYTEVRPADAFCLLVEKRYVNGRFIDYGEVTAAEFYTSDTAHRAFLHHRQDGGVSYYDEGGRSLRKQLLRAPLKYAPVTSTFGRRRHPVLGYTRAHNGTDYGVPTGTPVWSVGDGRVITAGWHGGFGRLVEVSHPNGWVSQYAHLSRIFVHPGQRVRQKDVVGLVGQTGLATGPHLHYGLKRHGTYVNSLAQKFERSPALAGDDLAAFNQQVVKLMDDLGKLRLAQRGSESVPKKG